MPFPTEDDLKQKLCPLLGKNCIGAACCMFRWSSQVDSRTGRRSAFCGIAGERGSYILAPSRAQQAQGKVAAFPRREPAATADDDDADPADPDLI